MLLCALLAWRYPLSYGLFDPRSRWLPLDERTTTALLIHLAIYLALTLCVLGGLRILLPGSPTGRERRAVVLIVVCAWLAASALLWLLTPGDSHDVYDYLFRGRMLALYGGSPLRDPPEQFATAPFYNYITWRTLVDAYGPLWEYASAGVTLAVQQTATLLGWPTAGLPPCPNSMDSCRLLAASMIGYRLLATALAGLCGWLIYRIVHHEAPALAPAALLCWLWNPLLLVSSAGGAHNDMWMLLFWLLAFRALQRRWWVVGCVCLGLAVQVKLISLLLAPVFGLWLVRQLGWRGAIGRGLAALAIVLPLSWLLYAPLGGWATLPRNLHERNLYVANSLQHVLLRWVHSPAWPTSVQRFMLITGPTLLSAALAVVTPLLLFGFRPSAWGRARVALREPVLWRTATMVVLLYLLLGSFWFQAWYVTWALALAALIPASALARWVLPWLTWGALASQVLQDYLPFVSDPPLEPGVRVALVVAMIWLPALVAGMVYYGQQRTVKKIVAT